MTTTTKPIPLFRAGDTSASVERLRGLPTCSRCHYIPTCYNDTHPIVFADEQVRQRRYECSPTRRHSYLRAIAVAAMVALRRATADDELSRPLELPDLRMFAMCHDVGCVTTPFQQATQATIIDTAEPYPEPVEAEPTLEYNWSRARRKIRAAAKAYSEQTHADY